jgi:glyoxylase-like metal-dependent hydrolase (beta-lactamase superfamily II)
VEGVERIWEDAAVEVHRLVVGPIANNVFVVRCRRTGDALLIDAANEHERLLEVCTSLGVRAVVETHGHWDHIAAVPALRDAGYQVAVRTEDAQMLDSYDLLLEDDEVVEVGRLRIRTVHTPGHTPGSICFHLEGTPLLFTGDTLFPGGPGNTKTELGDFSTIIRSITERIYSAYPDETVVLPGHGAMTTVGAERPSLHEWVERGW